MKERRTTKLVVWNIKPTFYRFHLSATAELHECKLRMLKCKCGLGRIEVNVYLPHALLCWYTLHVCIKIKKPQLMAPCHKTETWVFSQRVFFSLCGNTQFFFFCLPLRGGVWVHSHDPSIRSHRWTIVVWPDFQPMRFPEEPVCIDLFRQNPVFTTLHLKSPVHIVRPLVSLTGGWGSSKGVHYMLIFF
jgi:hypothetical protein